MKKVLIISHEMLAPDVYLRIKNEGNRVILACEQNMDILKGTLDRVPFAKRKDFYKWADLIIYDDTNFGDEPKLARDAGYAVVGGSKLVDKMELDREFGKKLAEYSGIKNPEMQKVTSFDEARKLVKDKPRRWVMKQQGKLDVIKGLNYMGKLEDGGDMIDHINWLESIWIEGLEFDFIFQEYVKGHEFATGAYWNGSEFLKDNDGDEVCEENFEHKALFAGDRGESTGEMFTLIRYKKAKESKIFQETLNKSREILKHVDFRGNIDINCKINEDGVYFLEYTPRFGVPASSGQVSIHKSTWYDLFYACATGTQIEGGFKFDPRWSIVAWLYTKPFPAALGQKFADMIEKKYEKAPPVSIDDKKELLETRLGNSRDIIVNFKEKLTDEEMNHLHFDGVYMKDGRIRIANNYGYVLTVTGLGDTPKEAGEKTEKLLKKLIVPKGFWRADFTSHYDESIDDLSKWGFLEKPENEIKDLWTLTKNKIDKVLR